MSYHTLTPTMHCSKYPTNKAVARMYVCVCVINCVVIMYVDVLFTDNADCSLLACK